MMNKNTILRSLLCLILAFAVFCSAAFAAETEAEVLNVLLLGTDQRTQEGYGRSDTMIIASINPTAGSVKLTSIMRDTWLEIEGHGEQKINAANRFGGPELAMQTVNQYFGTDIDKYILVDMQGFVTIINLMGGLSVPVTETEMNDINQQLVWDAMDFELVSDEPLESFGESVQLNGNQALAYARLRVSDSDYARVNRQYNVFKALFEEIIHYDALSLLAVVNAMFGYVETNLTFQECMDIASGMLASDMLTSGMESENIQQYRIPVDGTYKSGYYHDVWCIRPDFEANAELLHAFIYGEAA